MNLTFRKAGQDDIETLLGIYNFYISTTTATFDRTEISKSEFLRRVFIGHDGYPLSIVSTDAGELAGFCFLTRFRDKPAYDRTAEIGIYLKPEFTGKGFGTEVLSYLENIARSVGYKVLVASVSGENTASIRLFRKANFQECARYRQIAEKFDRVLDIIDFQKFISGE